MSAELLSRVSAVFVSEEVAAPAPGARAVPEATKYVFECSVEFAGGCSTWLTRRTYAQFAELALELQRRGGLDVETPLPARKGDGSAGSGLGAFLAACLAQCTPRHVQVSAHRAVKGNLPVMFCLCS